MLLVITYSMEARQSLRNVCNGHPDAVRRRFGRAALFEETERGALLALRLAEKHGIDVEVERTSPLNPHRLPDRVRQAAQSYEQEAHPNTPYNKFAVGNGFPTLEELREQEL